MPAITLRRDLRERAPGRLRHERHRARRARVHLEDVDLDRPSPRTARSSGRPRRARARACASALRSRPRSRARASAAAARSTSRPSECPASSMCCITPPMTARLPSHNAVDVDLDRVLQELVDEDASACRPRARLRPRACTYASSSRVVVRDHHRAAAEHVASGARAPGSRSPRRSRTPRRRRVAMPLARALEAELGEQLVEPPAILGAIDGVGAGAEQLHARAARAARRA